MKLLTNRKSIVLRVFAILFLAFSIVSCKEKGPREYIVDDTAVVNIGTIKEANGPYEFIILYKNETSDTIVAMQSRSSCRCTSPIVNGLPVPPGYFQRIPVKYDPAYQKGAIDAQVHIR